VAAYLFAPTQIWVTIAAKLNYDIVKLNPNPEQIKVE
jgi:tryptophan-rich sensory protein